MNRNLNLNISNDLNVSNSSEKELNDFLSDELLTYSEDKSQTLTAIYFNNNDISPKMDNNSQLSKKSNIYKKENFIYPSNSEITINYSSNKSLNQKDNKKNIFEKKIQKAIKYEINGNRSNKDLSSLQISLSNLLSESDSKDIFIFQNSKLNDNIYNNKINKNHINSFKNLEKALTNFSNENSKENKKIINNKNNNNEEYSYSICNYSQNTNSNNNSYLLKNNDNKNINIINNNNINVFNNLNNYKDKNYIKFINHRNNNNNNNRINKINQKKNHIINNKIRNKLNNQIIGKDKFLKYKFTIEKGENIELSINNNNLLSNNISKCNYIFNNNNYNNASTIKTVLSINKTHNFSINNSTFDNFNNSTEFYDKMKNPKITSIEIIKDILRNNKLIEKIDNKNYNKNKKNLINNKNIEIMNEDSKKFFYNPKKNHYSNDIYYINKNTQQFKSNKTENNFQINYNVPPTERNIKKDKNLILNNYIDKKRQIKKKNYNYFRNNSNSYTFNRNNSNNNNKKKEKKLNSYNNSNNRINKHILKEKKIRKNIEINEKNSRKNNTLAYNRKNLEFKKYNKYLNNECNTEPSKQIEKTKYNNNKDSNSLSINLINQIKKEQKKTTNKLLHKLKTLNNLNSNIIKKRNLFTLLKKSTKNKSIMLGNGKEKILDSFHKVGRSLTTDLRKKIKNNKKVKINKSNGLDDKIDIKRDIKGNNNKPSKILKTQINLTSLLNNFYDREKIRKNNKSLFNFGNIFFINQTNTLKRGDNYQLSSFNTYEKTSNEDNKEKENILKDNNNNSKLNSLNYSITKQKPKIINDFSNYKKKGNIDKNNDYNINLNIIERKIKLKKIDKDIKKKLLFS